VNEIIEHLKKVILDKSETGPVFIHSDMLHTMGICRYTGDRSAFLGAHVDTLREIATDRPLWMPAFNYRFPGTRLFDAKKDPSEVGPLSEYFRSKVATWRTPVPIFSVSGTGDEPRIDLSRTLDPFDEASTFGQLVDKKGTLLFYGARLMTATIIHFVERQSGGPLYRYDKVFNGRVTALDGSETDVSLLYHVRPLDRHMGYDEAFLEADLVRQGILRVSDKPGIRIRVAGAHSFCERLLELIKEDPLALIDDETRKWVEPILSETNGRRFTIEQFEQSA
jgi:aminoglycoside 3-N-acetyltransferase